MRSAEIRCPVGFKNYPRNLLVSTGTTTSEREGGRGAWNSLDRAAKSMTANESNPCEGESVDGASVYEEAARIGEGYVISAYEHLVTENFDPEAALREIESARRELEELIDDEDGSDGGDGSKN